MKQLIKSFIKDTPIYFYLIGIKSQIDDKRQVKKWIREGKPLPPPHIIKQRTLKELKNKYSLNVFIETGTLRGDMVFSMKDQFSQLFSIELNENMAKQAKKRFSKFRHITILQGDSVKILRDVLSFITQPCLFWLDAHYSGGGTAKGLKETPVVEELTAIFNHAVEYPVILIDDARCFTGQNDYPTMKELRDFVHKQYSDSIFVVENDIIRIYKKTLLFKVGLYEGGE